MALAAKRGKGHFSKQVMEAAKSMSEKQLRDFAKTKHKGLPEKKGDYIPSENEQNTVLQNYLKNRPLQPRHLQERDAINRQVPDDYQLGKYLGTTTPAHVLAGVYGPNLPQEVNKANRYNANQNYPLITPNVLNNTRVFESPMAYTTPFHGVTGVNPADGKTMPDKLTESPNFRDLNIINGFQPIQPGAKPNDKGFNYDNYNFRKFFTPKPVNSAFPIQHIMEHEVGGHRVYEGGAKQRLPVPLKWPGWPATNQPYQNERGEALNGLAAIQRDQFQNTGKRYESPDSFRNDINNVLNSSDIEKAMNTQGWNRPDAKRLIRSLVPMAPADRESFLNQAGRAIPGMVRNNTNTAPVKVGSYYYDSGDIDSSVDKLKDYFNSDNFRHPETSTDILPDSYDFSTPGSEEIQSIGESSGINPILMKMLGIGALSIPMYLLNKEHTSEKPKIKKAYIEGFLEKAAVYGYSASEIAEAVKIAESGWGDLDMSRHSEKVPIITANKNPGIVEHLKRNAGKYIGAGVGLPLAAYINSSGSGYVPGTLTAATAPLFIGDAIDNFREHKHIESLLQSPEALENLKNIIAARSSAPDESQEEDYQAKTASMLDKIKDYIKKHEPEPAEKGLKGFLEKQRKGLPQLIKMKRLDRMRELGRELDRKK